MSDDKRYEIEKIADILDIPPEKFGWFLIDLKQWYIFSRQFKELVEVMPEGVKVDIPAMVWIDDGAHGISEVTINGVRVKEAANEPF